ncbi:DoxX family protein [Parapedobacter lycopersici]|uniref:DoxX family protein n=1 Tax=Parapedobacter lycopersici TaxID=1864939 RepID=UPI0033414007
MNTGEIPMNSTGWNSKVNILFRLCFIFFSLHMLLFALNFLIGIFTLSGQGLHFLTFFQLANQASYLAVCLLIAVLATVVWSYYKHDTAYYRALDYWIRVIVRYRLAIGMFAYGWIKLFPLQMPTPTLSDLNTAYGDFLPWKIYWLTTGAASGGYESALGALEIIAGGLLLFRRTTSFGALLALLMLTNALGVNIAYQTGQYAFCLLLILAAIFLIAPDIPRLYRLLVLEQPARARKNPVPVSGRGLRITNGLRMIVAFGMVGYAYLVYTAYLRGPHLLPEGNGVNELYGYYEVTDFEWNGALVPYSLTDRNRWQNVVFEKWPTVSIKRAAAVPMDWTKEGFGTTGNLDRNYEGAGTVGRHYFHYTADTIHRVLHLQNKNIHQRNERWDLRYVVDSDGGLTLAGTEASGDSVRMTLRKVNRRYLLWEGRRRPIQLSVFN